MSLHMLGAADVDTSPKDEYARTVEAEFQEMKRLAELAKWPADLVPEVKAVDAAWQSAKGSANASKTSVARIWGPGSEPLNRLRALTGSLKVRLAGGGDVPTPSFWTRPILGPVPGYGVVVGGAGTLLVLGLFFRKVLS